MRRTVHSQPAYLLRRYPYGADGGLLDFLSREYGIVRLVHRKQRHQRHRQQNPQLCLEWLVDWREGRRSAGLASLVRAARSPAIERANPAPGSVRLLMSVSYMNELILRFFKPHDPHPDLYDCYRLVLMGLSDLPAEPLLRFFEFHLLRIAGFDIDAEGDLRALGADGDSVRLDGQRDGNIATAPMTVEAGERARQWLSACSALDYRLERDLRPQRGSEALARLSERFAHLPGDGRFYLRQRLRDHLGAHLGTDPLKTRQVIQRARELGAISWR